MTLYEFIEQEIRKRPSGEWYDPNGSSSRAVVIRMRDRGKLYSIWWEFCQVCSDIKGFFTEDFNGWDTPISWFAQLVILPVIFPISPFIRAHFRHKRAIQDYKREYRVKHYFDTKDD